MSVVVQMVSIFRVVSMVWVVLIVQMRIVVVLDRMIAFAGVLVRAVLVRMMFDHRWVQRVVVMVVVDRQYSAEVVLADHGAFHLPASQVKAIPCRTING